MRQISNALQQTAIGKQGCSRGFCGEVYVTERVGNRVADDWLIGASSGSVADTKGAANQEARRRLVCIGCFPFVCFPCTTCTALCTLLSACSGTWQLSTSFCSPSNSESSSIQSAWNLELNEDGDSRAGFVHACTIGPLSDDIKPMRSRQRWQDKTKALDWDIHVTVPATDFYGFVASLNTMSICMLVFVLLCLGMFVFYASKVNASMFVQNGNQIKNLSRTILPGV